MAEKRGGASVTLAAAVVIILLAAWTGVLIHVATYPAFPVSPLLDAFPDSNSDDHGLRTTAARLQLGLMLLIGIALCWWTYPARRAADRQSARSHRFTRGWAVGVWVVPFGNLVWPRQYLEDLGRACSPGDNPRSVLSYVWWTLWLGYLATTGMNFLFTSTSFGDLLTGPAFWVWVVGVPTLGIGAAAALALLVGQITWRLQRRATRAPVT